MFYEKCVRKNFPGKFYRKTPALESCFSKVADPFRNANLSKSKETPTQVFCEICEIFKNTYCEEHLRMTASKLLFREEPH